MCFFKGKRKAKIAEKDIVVYKVGYEASAKRFCSLHCDYTYGVNTLKKKGQRIINKAHKNRTLDREVYHTYTSLRKIRIWNVHSYPVGKFVIPKGTIYWENKEDKQIATTSIRYIEPHKEKTHVF